MSDERLSKQIQFIVEIDKLLKGNAPKLWEYAKEIIDDSIKSGYLKR